MTGIRARKSRRKKRITNVRVRSMRSRPMKLLQEKKRSSGNNALAKELLAERLLENTSIDRSYVSFGIAARCNADVHHKPTLEQQKVLETTLPKDGITELALTQDKEKHMLRYFSSGEIAWLGELKKVYGSNYKAMFYDVKRNPYQLTEKQLAKKMQHFDSLLQEATKEKNR